MESEQQIQYHVTVDGGQYEHEAFRTSVGEIDGASIEAELPTNFQAISAEADNQEVVCIACRDTFRAAEMEATVDAVGERDDGKGEDDPILSVERMYLCSQECATEFAMDAAGVEP